MNRTIACNLIAALSISTAPFGLHAQGMGGMEMKGMDMKKDKKAAAGQVHKASGKVTKVDKTGGSVTIAHGPVVSMSWPAMTMTFKAKDKALLDKVKGGTQVEFSFVESGKDYTITEIK